MPYQTHGEFFLWNIQPSFLVLYLLSIPHLQVHVFLFISIYLLQPYQNLQPLSNLGTSSKVPRRSQELRAHESAHGHLNFECLLYHLQCFLCPFLLFFLMAWLWLCSVQDTLFFMLLLIRWGKTLSLCSWLWEIFKVAESKHSSSLLL
jgi:hypothetical protein